ncbi:MAG: hypothetical protein R6U91_08020 [Bacillota bacterium]
MKKAFPLPEERLKKIKDLCFKLLVETKAAGITHDEVEKDTQEVMREIKAERNRARSH